MRRASGLFKSTTKAVDDSKMKREIIEFDHRFAATVVGAYPGLLAPNAEGSVPLPRSVSMVFSKHELELIEPSGIREVKLLGWPYTQLTSISWDHQHSSFRLTNPKAVVSDGCTGESYTVTIGTRDGPLGLNLVSTLSSGPGRGLSAAVETTSGQAAESAMKPGHLILSVNGTNTSHLKFSEAMDVLRGASRPVSIELAAVNATSKGAESGGDGPFIILESENSSELEQELKLRIAAARHNNGNSTPAPSITYVGIFAGAEKPKPFQRKRASLIINATDALPSPQSMRRMSMQATRQRQAGMRRILALQHIHEGHNYFKVKIAGGVKRFLLINYDSISVVVDPEQASLAQEVTPLRRIKEWKVQGQTVKLIVQASDHSDATSAQIYTVKEPVHLVHTLEFYINLGLTAEGLPPIKGSTHGRSVQKVHTLVGQVDAQKTSSAQLAEQMSSKAQSNVPLAKTRRGSIGGAKPPWWSKLCGYHGWLLKKGGMTKSWQRRFFVLYRTSQGHLLAYYSGVEETPLHSKDKKERNLMDICMVTAIRPVSKSPDAQEYSFDIVAVDREWTFCAESKEEMQTWLQLLSRAVDEDVAITPDDNLNFQVKPVIDPTNTLPKFDYTTMLKVQSQGIQICIGPEFQLQAFFWCYTDIHRWSVATHNDKPCLLMSVFLSDEFTRTQDFVFRTTESAKLSSAIEFYIEKFMSVMQLKAQNDAHAEGVDVNAWRRPTHAEDTEFAEEALEELDQDNEAEESFGVVTPEECFELDQG